MRDRHVVIVGAGIGGLACAARLAAAGLRVSVIEARALPGGKMRSLAVGGLAVESGPTVFTLRAVFDELFDACGGPALDDAVRIAPLATIARHVWPGGDTLDLFADPARSVDAVGVFGGAAAAAAYRGFLARAAGAYRALEHSFMTVPRPGALRLTVDAGPLALARINPFQTLWQALGRHFSAHPRLRQLFGRYATYAGSSPFAAPATLMLIAHVEQMGVWTIAGGMSALAAAVAELAAGQGAVLRFGAAVASVLVQGGAARGVVLDSGETIGADAVVLAGDAQALAGGLLGDAARGAVPAERGARSLSAMTWSVAGRVDGAALHHTVCFAEDSAGEFADVFGHRRMPANPTVYLCAPDRDAGGAVRVAGAERLFCIVNAPAIGDRHVFGAAEMASATASMQARLRSCGMEMTCTASTMTTPTDFAALYPGTGGALYGAATHGPWASFRRPGSRSRLAGLYLAGGSTHPGAGVPMAALSGKQAALAVLADGGSTRRWRWAGIGGGMPMR